MKARRSKEKNPKLDSKAQTKKEGQHIDMNYDKGNEIVKVSSQSRKSEFRVFSIVHLNILNF